MVWTTLRNRYEVLVGSIATLWNGKGNFGAVEEAGMYVIYSRDIQKPSEGKRLTIRQLVCYSLRCKYQLLFRLAAWGLILVHIFEAPTWTFHLQDATNGHLFPSYGINFLPVAATCALNMLFVLILAVGMGLEYVFEGSRTRWRLLVIMSISTSMKFMESAISLGLHATGRAPVSFSPIEAVLIILVERKLISKLPYLIRVLPPFCILVLMLSAVVCTYTAFGFLVFDPGSQEMTQFFPMYGQAIWNMLMVLDGSNWPTPMMPAYDQNRLYVIYFIIYLVVCNWGFLNLTLGFIFSSFQIEMQRIKGVQEDIKQANLRNAYAALDTQQKGYLLVAEVEPLIEYFYNNFEANVIEPPNHNERMALAAQLDLTRNGRITMEEFMFFHEKCFESSLNSLRARTHFDRYFSVASVTNVMQSLRSSFSVHSRSPSVDTVGLGKRDSLVLVGEQRPSDLVIETLQSISEDSGVAEVNEKGNSVVSPTPSFLFSPARSPRGNAAAAATLPSDGNSFSAALDMPQPTYSAPNAGIDDSAHSQNHLLHPEAESGLVQPRSRIKSKEEAYKKLTIQEVMQMKRPKNVAEVIIFIARIVDSVFYDILSDAIVCIVGIGLFITASLDAYYVLVAICLLESFSKLLVKGFYRFRKSYRNSMNGLLTVLMVALCFKMKLHAEDGKYRYPIQTIVFIRFIFFPLNLLVLERFVESRHKYIHALRFAISGASDFLFLVLVLFMCIYTAASLGVQLFGGMIRKYGDNFELLENSLYGQSNQYWPLNFNDMLSGMATMFVLLHVNNMHVTAAGFQAVATDTALLFFTAWYVIGVLLMLNVVIAFFLTQLISYVTERERNEENEDSKLLKDDNNNNDANNTSSSSDPLSSTNTDNGNGSKVSLKIPLGGGALASNDDNSVRTPSMALSPIPEAVETCHAALNLASSLESTSSYASNTSVVNAAGNELSHSHDEIDNIETPSELSNSKEFIITRQRCQSMPPTSMWSSPRERDRLVDDQEVPSSSSPSLAPVPPPPSSIARASGKSSATISPKPGARARKQFKESIFASGGTRKRLATLVESNYEDYRQSLTGNAEPGLGFGSSPTDPHQITHRANRSNTLPASAFHHQHDDDENHPHHNTARNSENEIMGASLSSSNISNMSIGSPFGSPQASMSFRQSQKQPSPPQKPSASVLEPPSNALSVKLIVDSLMDNDSHHLRRELHSSMKDWVSWGTELAPHEAAAVLIQYARDGGHYTLFSTKIALSCYRLRQKMAVLLRCCCWILMLLKVFERPYWTFSNSNWKSPDFPKSGIYYLSPRATVAIKLPVMVVLLFGLALEYGYKEDGKLRVSYLSPQAVVRYILMFYCAVQCILLLYVAISGNNEGLVVLMSLGTCVYVFWFDKRAFAKLKLVLHIMPSFTGVLLGFLLLVLFFASMGPFIFNECDTCDDDDFNRSQFQTLPDSVWSVFVAITSSSYPGQVMPLYRRTRWFFLFFFAFISLGAYGVLNLALVVVLYQYNRKAQIHADTVHAAQDILMLRAFQVLDTRSRGFLEYSQVKAVLRELYAHYTDFRKGGVPSDHKQELLIKILDIDGDGLISPDDFAYLVDVTRIKLKMEDEIIFIEKSCPGCVNTDAYANVARFFKSKLFNTVMDSLATALAIADLALTPDIYSLHTVRRYYSIKVVLWIVLLCKSIPIYIVRGHRTFFKHYHNKVDVFVCTSFAFVVIALACTKDNAPLYAGIAVYGQLIEIVRVLLFPRVFRSLLPQNSYQLINSAIKRIIRSVYTLFIVFACAFFGMCNIGMFSFGGKINTNPDASENSLYPAISTSQYGINGFWTLNFNDMPSAFVTLFCCLHVSDFDVITSGFVAATSTWARAYFTLWYVVGVMLLLNIVKSYFLSGYLMEAVTLAMSYRLPFIKVDGADVVIDGASGGNSGYNELHTSSPTNSKRRQGWRYLIWHSLLACFEDHEDTYVVSTQAHASLNRHYSTTEGVALSDAGSSSAAENPLHTAGSSTHSTTVGSRKLQRTNSHSNVNSSSILERTSTKRSVSVTSSSAPEGGGVRSVDANDLSGRQAVQGQERFTLYTHSNDYVYASNSRSNRFLSFRQSVQSGDNSDTENAATSSSSKKGNNLDVPLVHAVSNDEGRTVSGAAGGGIKFKKYVASIEFVKDVNPDCREMLLGRLQQLEQSTGHEHNEHVSQKQLSMKSVDI